MWTGKRHDNVLVDISPKLPYLVSRAIHRKVVQQSIQPFLHHVRSLGCIDCQIALKELSNEVNLPVR